jgi:hypothetical protein
MNQDLCLFAVTSPYSGEVLGDFEDDDDTCFVTARTLTEAIVKWKETVARYINEDYESEGVARVVTADDVDDPESVTFFAGPGQLML